MTADEVLGFLEESRTAVLATWGEDGYPHQAAMWYLPAGNELEMWTYRKSQKARNLQRNARCSVLVERGESYGELRGVLVKGQARLTDSYEEVAGIGRRLYDRYTLPHTRVPLEQGPQVEIDRQAHKRIGIILPLEDVASWDHSKL